MKTSYLPQFQRSLDEALNNILSGNTGTTAGTTGSSTGSTDSSSYNGSTSLWAMIPSGLVGLSSLVSAFKGNPTTVNNVIPAGNTGSSATGGMGIYLMIGIALIVIVLLVVMTKK